MYGKLAVSRGTVGNGQGTHIFISVESCSLQSRSANFPSSSFFAIAFCLSGFAIATSCLVDHKETRQ